MSRSSAARNRASDDEFCRNTCWKLSKSTDFIELFNKGVIIIACAVNSNQLTFPASFKEVIGVQSDRYSDLSFEKWIYFKDSSDGIDFSLSLKNKTNLSLLKPYNQCNQSKISDNSNSFAPPYLSAYIINELSKTLNREFVIKHLIDGSISIKNEFDYRKNLIPALWVENYSRVFILYDISFPEKHINYLLQKFYNDDIIAIRSIVLQALHSFDISEKELLIYEKELNNATILFTAKK